MPSYRTPGVLGVLGILDHNMGLKTLILCSKDANIAKTAKNVTRERDGVLG